MESASFYFQIDFFFFFLLQESDPEVLTENLLFAKQFQILTLQQVVRKMKTCPQTAAAEESS